MKNLSLVILCLTLSGCFLTPQGNNNNTQTKTPFKGVVVMKDLQGAIHNQVSQPQPSMVAAMFYKENNSLRKSMVGAAAEAKGLKCEVYKEPLRNAAATTREPISVGTVEFNSSKLTENDEHVYSMEIPRDYPSGVFAISASGSSVSDPFTEAVSMPEGIRSPRVNGTDIEKEGVVLSKANAWKFEWSRPAVLEASNIAFIMVSAINKQQTQQVDVECYLLESELWTSQGTTLSLELPADYRNQLPEAEIAEFRIARWHQFRGRNPAISNTIVTGSRTMATRGIIQQ